MKVFYKGRGYAAYEDDDYAWPSDTVWPDESVYYEADEWGPEGYNPEEDEAFDYDAGYYGEEEPNEDPGESTEDPYELAEQYDHAYATYLDARQRFQQLKLARGYLPVVALTDGHSFLSYGIQLLNQRQGSQPLKREVQAQEQGQECHSLSTQHWWQGS